MTVIHLSQKDKGILKRAGLNVTNTNVSGTIKNHSSDKVLKAYESSLRYGDRFTLYVGDMPVTKQAIKKSALLLSTNDLLISHIETHPIYSEILKLLKKYPTTTDIFISSWEFIEVYHSLKEDTIPHFEPRFLYTPHADVYQVKYNGKHYRVEVSENTSDNNQLYQVRIADLPLVYMNVKPALSFIEEHLRSNDGSVNHKG